MQNARKLFILLRNIIFSPLAFGVPYCQPNPVDEWCEFYAVPLRLWGISKVSFPCPVYPPVNMAGNPTCMLMIFPAINPISLGKLQ